MSNLIRKNEGDLFFIKGWDNSNNVNIPTVSENAILIEVNELLNYKYGLLKFHCTEQSMTTISLEASQNESRFYKVAHKTVAKLASTGTNNAVSANDFSSEKTTNESKVDSMTNEVTVIFDLSLLLNINKLLLVIFSESGLLTKNQIRDLQIFGTNSQAYNFFFEQPSLDSNKDFELIKNILLPKKYVYSIPFLLKTVVEAGCIIIDNDKIYVSAREGYLISVFSYPGFNFITSFAANKPVQMTLDKPNNRMLFASYDYSPLPYFINFFDLTTYEITTFLNGNAKYFGCTIDFLNKKIFFSIGYAIEVWNLETMVIEQYITGFNSIFQIKIDTQNQKLIAADYVTNKIHVINLNNYAERQEILLPMNSYSSIAIDALKNKLYVCGVNDSFIRVYNLYTLNYITNILCNIGHRSDMAIDGNKLIVCSNETGKIVQILITE